jgi:radical SAM protein with 4Fe4S-binding SPASM domain
MKMQTYRNIIRGLSDMGGVKEVCLYRSGESLLHPDIVEMVRLARTIAPKVWIKSNGLLLTEDIADKLAGAGLSVLTISIIAPDGGGYRKLTGKKVDYLWLRNHVMNIYNKVKGRTFLHVKMADAGFGPEGIAKFRRTFIDCDFIDVEYLHQPSAQVSEDFTLGLKPKVGTHGEVMVHKEVCPLLFYSLNFLRNGKVVVCSNDHQGDTEVGDVYYETVSEIWNGDRLKELRLQHLTGNKGKNSACRYCEYDAMLPDNIDKDADKIYAKIHN